MLLILNGTIAGASNIDVFFSGTLVGDETEPATEAIPEIEFVAREEDYSEDHPDLEGMPISFNTLMLSFELDTTVSEANAILKDIDAEIVGGLPGVADQAKGILFLRVPSSSHEEMIQIIEDLENNPKVSVVVQDVLMTPTLVTKPSNDTALDRCGTFKSSPNEYKWTWSSTPAEGNWGLEIMRVPQMWNLNAAIQKRGTTVNIGVLDMGFARGHPDLKYSNDFTGRQHSHGTHVAGIIAATHNNGIGIDGVNPFADLIVTATPSFINGNHASFGEQITSASGVFINPSIKVVNLSIGYNWQQSQIDSSTSAEAQSIANSHGSLFKSLEIGMQAIFKQLPVIVVAAGNESGKFHPTQNAKYASPWTNAALVQDVKNIIVVESVAYSQGKRNNATRSFFSNVGGHVSAPGSNIMSTFHTLSHGYEVCSGTSMAAPHVAGLVSFLYNLYPNLQLPTLDSNPILDLLRRNGKPVEGDAEHLVDAFQTVMDLDRIQNDDRVLRMLLDIDDGTLDGNERVRENTIEEDADGDGGIGDGEIDMSDFRRWRDWLLQLENSGDLNLDGGAAHPKKDVNGDGLVEGPEKERIYPRGDFNGDGQLSRTAKSRVPGAINSVVTDLEVLKSQFSDQNYDKGQLDNLLNSGDIEINITGCFKAPNRIYSSTSITDEEFLEEREHLPENNPTEIYTLNAPRNYATEVKVLDDTGTIISSVKRREDFSVSLGNDHFWKPACDFLVIELEDLNIRKGLGAKLRLRAGVRQGQNETITYLENVHLVLSVRGGSLAASEGITDSEGYFETTLRAHSVDKIVLEVDALLERRDGGEIKRSSKIKSFDIETLALVAVTP